MKKQILSLALALTMVLTLTACIIGGSDEPPETTDPPAEESTLGLTEAPTDTPTPTEAPDDDLADPSPTPAPTDEPLPREDERLSNILYGFTFELDGDTITLPITLEKFQALGWEVEATITFPKTLEGSKVITKNIFVRNGKAVDIGLVNVGEEELAIEKCLVYRIKCSSKYADDAVIELPKGIILGVSNRDDVVNTYGGPTRLNTSGDEQTLTYYPGRRPLTLTPFGSVNLYPEINIIIDTTNGNIVTGIEVKNAYQE
jgi:hypothetical protein